MPTILICIKNNNYKLNKQNSCNLIFIFFLFLFFFLFYSYNKFINKIRTCKYTHKTVQSDQKRKRQLVRFWPPYFGIHMVFYLSITLRKEEIAKKRPYKKKKKVLFHQDSVPCHKLIATMVKLHFELLPHPPFSLYLAPSNYYLFAEVKRMLQGKRFGFNEEVITETEACYEAKDKSLYKKGMEMLEKRRNECITLKRDYINECSQILPKSCCFNNRPTNLWSDVFLYRIR